MEIKFEINNENWCIKYLIMIIVIIVLIMKMIVMLMNKDGNKKQCF